MLRPIGAVVLLLLTTTPAIPRELPSITDRSGRLEYRSVDGEVTIFSISGRHAIEPPHAGARAEDGIPLSSVRRETEWQGKVSGAGHGRRRQ